MISSVLIIRVKIYWSYAGQSLSPNMEYELDGDELLSTAVVRAVSAVEGREPLNLPPLVHVLDTDALDVLFASDGRGKPKTGGRLSFVYSESHVTIENGEYLTIQPVRNSRKSSNGHVSYLEP